MKMKNRVYDKKYRIRLSVILMAFVMVFAAAFAMTGTQAVYAEGEETPQPGPETPTQTVTDQTAAKPKVNLVKVKKSKNKTKATITISRAQLDGKNAKKVLVRTWSKTRGRADMVRYKAKKIKGNKWRVTVDSTKHCYKGTFVSRVYVNGKYVKEVRYKLRFPKTKGRLITRAQSKKSGTGWLALVDKTTYRVGLFKGRKGNWKLVKSFACGDGAPATPTPSGTFRAGSKGPYFDSGIVRCFYFTEICPHYYFHSVLCDPSTGQVRPGRQLGVSGTHGCVRLAVKNARWLQEHLPTGSTIFIYR